MRGDDRGSTPLFPTRPACCRLTRRVTKLPVWRSAGASLSSTSSATPSTRSPTSGSSCGSSASRTSSPTSCPACPRSTSRGWSSIRECRPRSRHTLRGAGHNSSVSSVFIYFRQEAQDAFPDQRWPCDRRDLLPDVSVSRLHGDRLLRRYIQRTGQGESAAITLLSQ